MARGLSECRFEQVSVQPESIACIESAASQTTFLQERFRIGVHRLQTDEERVELKLVMA
jgi:hypothetical protein